MSNVFYMYPHVIIELVWILDFKYILLLLLLLLLLCENNVQACVFHVEFSIARDMTVDFCCICPSFSTCIYMLFLLCGNNVLACVFHVECNAT